MFTNKNFSLLFLLLGSGVVLAQSDSLSLDKAHDINEVIISATRAEKKISNLPIQVQVITKEEIENINTVRLAELLNEQTGLITISDYGGEGIQMQGLDSEYTLVMIDGVPLVGRTAGTLDLNRISVGNVERIEIIKGASSSLYGNEALGGIINIITKKPKKGVSTYLNYKLASFDTHDLTADFSYKKNKFSFNSFFNYNGSGGYDLDESTVFKTIEPFKSFTVNTKASYEFKPKNKLSFSGRYYNQTQEAIISKTVKGDSKINEWNILGKYTHNFNNKWDAHFEMYLTEHHAYEDFQKLEDAKSDYKHYMFRPELRIYHKINPKHNIVFGSGVTYEKLQKNVFNTNPTFTSPYLYTQYDGYITKSTNVILGARYDFHSEYNSQFSPKIAIKQKLNKMFGVRGSVGYGFKTPDFRTLYYDFTNSAVGYTVLGYNVVPVKLPEMISNGLINQVIIPISNFKDNKLKPESSVSYNIGVDLKYNNRFSTSLNFFRNEIKDLINTIIVAKKTNGSFVYSYENLDKVYTQGLEVNSKFKINNNLTVSGGYQLLYAIDQMAKEKFKNGEVYAKDEQLNSFKLNEKDYYGLYNRSRHMANIKVFYKNNRLGLDTNIRTIYRGSYGIIDTNSNGFLDNYDKFVDGYFITNFAIHKKFFNHYKVGFGMDNVFDFKDTQNIANIPGRIIYGTLNINF